MASLVVLDRLADILAAAAICGGKFGVQMRKRGVIIGVGFEGLEAAGAAVWLQPGVISAAANNAAVGRERKPVS
jgi:hypothetical protein